MYGIFCSHIERVVSLQGILEASVSEGVDGLVSVVHSKGHTFSFEIGNWKFLSSSILSKLNRVSLNSSSPYFFANVASS